MRYLIISTLLFVTLANSANAQRKKKNDDAFPRESPAVGQQVPEVVVYDTKGNEFSMAKLRGHYTVLTFGCLT